jgi:hypothetical protein
MGKMPGGGCKQSEREVQEAKKRQILQSLESLKIKEAAFLAQLGDFESATDKEKTDD